MVEYDNKERAEMQYLLVCREKRIFIREKTSSDKGVARFSTTYRDVSERKFLPNQ